MSADDAYRHRTDSTPSAPPGEPETFEIYTRRKLREHETRLDEIDEVVGREGSEVRRQPATGLHLCIEELRKSVDKMTSAIEAYDAARAAEAAAAAKKREPWSWAIKLALGTVITTSVGGGLIALGAVVARHWH